MIERTWSTPLVKRVSSASRKGSTAGSSISTLSMLGTASYWSSARG